MVTPHAESPEVVIKVRDLVTRFGSNTIHDGIDLDVMKGEVIGVVGGSGTGKSVLLRQIIGLLQPAEGSVEILGVDRLAADPKTLNQLRSRWGMLFQDGALFSSLTVAQNIEVPLKAHSHHGPEVRRRIAALKIALAGLPPDAADKYPSELSGGMRKRAGLARALSLDPEILFLDEPTAGLDPIGAAAFDQLILGLKAALGLTVVMITHDLDSLYTICDRLAVLIDKKVRVGTLAELASDPHPWLQDYFQGPRGRAATAAMEKTGHVA